MKKASKKNHPDDLARRPVLRGAAWAVPVVVATSSAASAGVSPGTVSYTATFAPTSVSSGPGGYPAGPVVTVTDQDGNPVPNAAITLEIVPIGSAPAGDVNFINRGFGTSQTGTTDANGTYPEPGPGGNPTFYTHMFVGNNPSSAGSPQPGDQYQILAYVNGQLASGSYLINIT